MILALNQTPTRAFDYYVIDVQQWQVIERVSWPWMKVVPEPLPIDQPKRE